MSTGYGSYPAGGPLDSLNSSLVNSWVRQLTSESEDNKQRSHKLSNLPDNDTNKSKRRVFNGHYVLVTPTGLPHPKLVVYSRDVACNVLQLAPTAAAVSEIVESPDFLQFVSGNLTLQETWATPYALSIMGERYTNNCPFGTGDGYGDGRAISIGEVANGYELQLKGAGKTPFHRGADGRAVLRSSVREFLASEAMHWLDVPTTRALSLVVSGSETVQRPWYSESAQLQIPNEEDPRLEQFPPEQRKAILRSMRNQKADPNILQAEHCAITCRVAPSFVRIGHLDLFARRATSVLKEEDSKRAATTTTEEEGETKQPETSMDVDNNKSPYDTSSPQWKELEDLIWHACYREYRQEAYDPFYEKKDIVSASRKLLELSAKKIAAMIGHWIRVGFTQGNFNADNCLIGGYTMDYGPFGWVEEYSPVYAKWTGSGQHYGFLNQPIAGLANYNVLAVSIAPVISAKTGQEEESIVDFCMTKAKVIFQHAAAEAYRIKMGLTKDNAIGDHLWKELEPLLRGSRVDWTLFWRQLTYVMRDYPDLTSTDYSGMMKVLEGANDSNEAGEWPRYSPFYEKYSDQLRLMWVDWIKMWRQALVQESKSAGAGHTGTVVYDRMRGENPKFVLREWMLADAYKAAAKGNYALIHSLHELSQHPYEEGTDEETKKYYRRTPEKVQMCGGIHFMS